jgi:peptidoglycan/xylan/chitin deacetylase (PgdA/CDA1 family)
MEQLAEAGFSTVSLDEPRPASGNPARRFVLTFDDGYRNVLEHAAPVLARHRFRAIQFIVAGAVGGTNQWDVREGGEVEERLMDWSELREWLAQGHEIGSHSVTHPRLTRLTRDQQREELRASKHRLEDELGVEVRHFCYPYGDFDPALADLVRECGYRTACTQVGGVNTAATDPFQLLRIEGRYPKRSPRAILQRFLRRWFGAGA